MVDRVEKFDGSQYRVDQTPESHDEEQKRRQQQQEEEKKKKKQKSQFKKEQQWSKVLPASEERAANPLLAQRAQRNFSGHASIKTIEDSEPGIDHDGVLQEEESMSIRVLKRWKILDAVGDLRPGVLLTYLLAISAIITSLILMVRIILS